MRIPINAVPGVRLVKRFILGPGSLEDTSFKQEVMCAEERTTLPPAIFLPDQLERVAEQKIHGWGAKSREEAIAEATATAVVHAPAIAYHIKDATLIDGRLFAGRFKYPIAQKSLYATNVQEPRRFNIAALASSFLGTKYFGHWLTDDSTRFMLAEQFGTPLCARMPVYVHQRMYQKYFEQNWEPTDRAYIDHLVIFQDFSQSSFKRERYRKLRERIKKRFPVSTRRSNIFLRRGQTGSSRSIQNEEAIVGALVKRGFMVVDIASDRLEHIVEPLLSAKLVVSMEGSHVAHCTLTVPEDSALLILEPPDKFSGVHRSQAGCLGVKFGFVVGEFGDAGYRFSVNEILQTIDLLLNAVEK